MEKKVEGLKRVVRVHNEQLDKVYRPRLRALRDTFRHRRRCFVIGNGPSLNRTDLSQLEGEVTFCTNAFFLKFPDLTWRPTFHVVEDHLVAEDRASEINSLTGITKIYPAYLAYCLDAGPETVFINHRARKSFPEGFDFSKDAAAVTYTGCTVTFTCLQLAYYLGFDEIFLVGVDADYKIPETARIGETYGTSVIDMDSDDPNHFHPDYFGKGKRWHDPQTEKMIEAYTEAKKVVEASGRRIINSTVGGKLEVFPRRAFSHVFPDAAEVSKPKTNGGIFDAPKTPVRDILKPRGKVATHQSRFPKLLVLDMTPVGGVTATGSLKQSLLADWTPERCLHVSAHGRQEFACAGGPIPDHGGRAVFDHARDVKALVTEYDPDVILYRPLPDKPELHKLAMAILKGQSSPFVTWIMDDWPNRLSQSDPKAFEKWRADLRHLFSGAAVNLSISEPMSAEMERRYGQRFTAIHNGIDPAEWSRHLPESPAGRPVSIRYSGGLAQDMALDSILDIAEAVEQMSADHDIVFEINTRAHWYETFGSRFASFKSTRISLTEFPRRDYVDWLREGDILVVAYNFDAASQAYAKLSFANKLPELLASGRPVFAVGPADQASIGLLVENGLGVTVGEPGVVAVRKGLDGLVASRQKREDIGLAGRHFALKHLQLSQQAEKLHDLIRTAADQRRSEPRAVDHAKLSGLVSLGQSQMPNIQKSGGPPRSRLLRIARFYLGWRGAVALLALMALFAPGLTTLSEPVSVSTGLQFLPGVGGLMLVFFIGYLYTLMEDHVRNLEMRLEALAQRRPGGSGIGRD